MVRKHLKMKLIAFLAVVSVKLGLSLPPFPVSDDVWQESLKDVDGMLSKVPDEYKKFCERVLRGESEQTFSQAWQDWFLWRNFFAGQTTGLYLDIGTNDAVVISNTIFFDKCVGWQGVCFEMNKQYHPHIREKRSCQLVPNCVLGQAASVQVAGNGVGGSVVHRKSSGMPTSNNTQEKKCVGILDELNRLKLSGKTVDLLSIDIEGSEPYVLKCWPWKEIPVRVILIETNKHSLDMVDRFFHGHDYINAATLLGRARSLKAKKLGAFPLDNVYVRMPFTYPQGEPDCDAADLKQNPYCGKFERLVRKDRQSEWYCKSG
mmetsp:Transcript_21709/g.49079  ORF Transcript_21709/g.49079 Transcript_21709/m.49079 type:complete len:318 (-) Transcript_21709:344-1297(-)|eukprot:CAMPEP_0172613746 /NCGR_PEP_ID=MMETSP1068-20121228/46668_1 /TAXON_ID=35684 /ORGANISM="Pseudopedinella elastica, Strain CCMP716" /LENGTH=317 /DNA_ID=CAMNT_0013418313 /DNA_START=65 /DNA_END=1018 /DNA_ORIENTATION=-